MNTGQLKPLLDTAAKTFAAHDSNIACTLVRSLTDPAMTDSGKPPALMPACSALASVLNGHRGDMLECVASSRNSLHWRTPGFGSLPTEIARNIAVVEILGPDGMIRNDLCRFGLLLQKKNLRYPPHRHAAEELYAVLSGRADWSVDGKATVSRAAGEFVHHQCWQSHSIQTRAEPLLAMWGWVGDINSDSYSLAGYEITTDAEKSE